MTKPLLPPQYVNVPAALAYGDLSRTVIVTGLRIYGLGWRYRYARTDPIAIADLCVVCGVSRSKLYEHLGELRKAGMLQYSSMGGRFTFTFHLGDASPVFGTDARLDGVVVSSSEQQQYSRGSKGGYGGDGGQSRLPDWARRRDVLDRIGVWEPVRTEIAELEHASVEYLEAWAAWFYSQDRLGVGALIVQLRAGVKAPETVNDYIGGRYSEFIQR